LQILVRGDCVEVVRWLVEVKNADIESSDRGNFTALLNAAWAGDKTLVRFLLQKGADRTKVGRFHYTKAVAPSDFEGLTAEGWAEKNGHSSVATLLRLGL
jgi:ankyrin repeat protein